MTIAVYPGTFDPMTKGHEDLIYRASHIFDYVVVAVASSAKKKPLLDLQNRCRLAQELCDAYDNVIVEPFDGLLKDVVR
ncbi:protein containing Cytidyltransferase-related domain protein, partial [gut metagenome]